MDWEVVNRNGCKKARLANFRKMVIVFCSIYLYMVNEKNGFFTDIVKSIDPLYTLPNYRGEIHFHCGTKDNLLPPASCQAAFDACINAKERKLFWHNLGHSMPKEKHLSEALKFFSGKTGLEIDEPLVNGCFACALNQRWKIAILKWSARA